MRITAIAVLCLFLPACGGRNVPQTSQAEVAAMEAEYKLLTGAHDDCVLHSAKRSYRQSRDASLAVETGFQACATEEIAFRNRPASGISPSFAAGAVDKHKSSLKTLLVQILPADGIETLAGNKVLNR